MFQLVILMVFVLLHYNYRKHVIKIIGQMNDSINEKDMKMLEMKCDIAKLEKENNEVKQLLKELHCENDNLRKNLNEQKAENKKNKMTLQYYKMLAPGIKVNESFVVNNFKEK